jgi:hypothetical protein
MADLDPPTSVAIQGLRSMPNRFKHFPDTIRDTFLLTFHDVRLTGRSIHYPNCLLQTGSQYINPYDERVMSLQKDTFYDGDAWTPPHRLCTPASKRFVDPVYFFIYNVDNYYHFVYDTLPILYGYTTMKQTYPSLRLLIQTSHPTKKTLPPFVLEMLAAYGIENPLFAESDILYEKMFVGTSLTHGRQSNSPPSAQAYTVWNRLTYAPQSLPKRIYVSRRSWVHGETQNMGTNYTTRRKCMNEDAVVKMLKEHGIMEIFTECLSTEYKLAMFAQAEVVVGVIGGGMCNLLFSPQTTKSLCIVTPDFLRINERFKYSMDHTQIIYSHSAHHLPSPLKYTLYTRVKITNPESPAYGQVGEIEEHLTKGAYVVRMSSNDVAGFSQDFTNGMEGRVFQEWELEPLDNGLNSPYICYIPQLETCLKKLLEA